MASRALFKPQLSRSFRRFTTAVSEVSETKVSNTEFAKQRDGIKHHAARKGIWFQAGENWESNVWFFSHKLYRVCFYLAENLSIRLHSKVSRAIIINHGTLYVTLKNNIVSLLATGANAYNLYQQHQEHVKHHPPKFVNYEYRNWRVRVSIAVCAILNSCF